MKDLIVKKSKVEGKGIFANRDFKKGEVVLKWDVSKKLTLDQVKKLPKNKIKYVSFGSGEYFLMPIPERYVNHSCDPNTKVKGKSDVAIKNIKKGEEITSGYSHDLPPGFEMKCKCGSRNCKKIVKSKN